MQRKLACLGYYSLIWLSTALCSNDSWAKLAAHGACTHDSAFGYGRGTVASWADSRHRPPRPIDPLKMGGDGILDITVCGVCTACKLRTTARKLR